MEYGLKSVEVYVKGPGSGREAAIRSLQAAGLEVNMIKDVTPIPHNGCRPPKRRRVNGGFDSWLDISVPLPLCRREGTKLPEGRPLLQPKCSVVFAPRGEQPPAEEAVRVRHAAARKQKAAACTACGSQFTATLSKQQSAASPAKTVDHPEPAWTTLCTAGIGSSRASRSSSSATANPGQRQESQHPLLSGLRE
jgi:hypothetical protein